MNDYSIKFWEIYDKLEKKFPELSQEELSERVERIISAESLDEDDKTQDD